MRAFFQKCQAPFSPADPRILRCRFDRTPCRTNRQVVAPSLPTIPQVCSLLDRGVRHENDCTGLEVVGDIQGFVDNRVAWEPLCYAQTYDKLRIEVTTSWWIAEEQESSMRSAGIYGLWYRGIGDFVGGVLVQ